MALEYLMSNRIQLAVLQQRKGGDLMSIELRANSDYAEAKRSQRSNLFCKR